MVVMITGGSRGIGEAIVRSARAAGHDVFFTFARESARSEALAAELDARKTVAGSCDLTLPSAAETAVDACLCRFGRLDALVNNAGIFAENPFDGRDFAAWRAGWQRTFAINLFGAADVAWFAMRSMRGNAPGADGVRGRIVNVTSRAAHRGELSFADYGASKAALANLTRSIARGCARDGIVAFNVAPGFIETEMARESIEAEGERIRGEIPSGRIGRPDEVASIVTLLLSGGADYATGTTIDVNGASYVR